MMSEVGPSRFKSAKVILNPSRGMILSFSAVRMFRSTSKYFQIYTYQASSAVADEVPCCITFNFNSFRLALR